jgi:hypothetical protein
VNKVCLRDPVSARRTEMTTRINRVKHFIPCVSLTVVDIIIGLMVYMLTVICRNINQISYNNFSGKVALFILHDIVGTLVEVLT